jgi:hypothetical protein
VKKRKKTDHSARGTEASSQENIPPDSCARGVSAPHGFARETLGVGITLAPDDESRQSWKHKDEHAVHDAKILSPRDQNQAACSKFNTDFFSRFVME